ncbi:pro-sigmaK processing inhibitor BofA family protein [uncultured Selenomonas sp.]|mgnify:FL=1|jgi:sigma-K factor processing regulatory protein bofA|uniref:pro-sigmaK processing inhibitor BofA family protein n=1 Tax=uncultured Selenomonas sp. TaxID=159275 RepID=UPI0028DCCC09|nr:pro-sigmaK processing inhibitor BofA family protein [uncultured Selenomonas sp.]
MLDIIAALAAGLLILLIAAKLLSQPFRLLKKFIINSVIGAVLLSVVKLLGLSVTINILTSLVAGIFGVPGVVAVLAWSYI